MGRSARAHGVDAIAAIDRQPGHARLGEDHNTGWTVSEVTPVVSAVAAALAEGLRRAARAPRRGSVAAHIHTAVHRIQQTGNAIQRGVASETRWQCADAILARRARDGAVVAQPRIVLDRGTAGGRRVTSVGPVGAGGGGVTAGGLLMVSCRRCLATRFLLRRNPSAPGPRLPPRSSAQFASRTPERIRGMRGVCAAIVAALLSRCSHVTVTSLTHDSVRDATIERVIRG